MFLGSMKRQLSTITCYNVDFKGFRYVVKTGASDIGDNPVSSLLLVQGRFVAMS